MLSRQEVIASSKTSFTFQENPHKPPQWKAQPTRLHAAHMLHPELYTPSVPSALSTYVHGDGFSPRSPRQVKGAHTEPEPEKQVLVSAFEGIRHICLHREHEHLEKVDRVRQSILELTTARHPVEPSGTKALPVEEVSTVSDLRAVLPLVRVCGEAQQPVANAPTFHTQVESHDGYQFIHTPLSASVGHTDSSWSYTHSPRKQHQQAEASMSPRPPPPASSPPSPRRTSVRSVTLSSPSKPASGIAELPPPTTARDVFSGAAGAGYQMKLQAPYRPQDRHPTDTPSRVSSAGLNNTIPASHHILRQYVNYLQAEPTGPPVRIPERTKEPTRPNHKVSLNLPKVKFVPPSAPGSAQAGMWTMPSPVASTPSSRCGRGSAPASPFLVNVATRRNEYDDLYEAERMKLKAEPLLLTTPISGVSNSILSVRRVAASEEDAEKGACAEGVVMDHSLVPRPPPVAKAAAKVAAHMKSALVIESKKLAAATKRATAT